MDSVAALGGKGIGVGGDLTVLEGDDARRVLLRQLGVVGDHHDQPILGDLLEQIHDLDTGVAVQRAGRLVGEQDIRIVDQRARDRDTLHLTAGELRGLFVDMLLEPDLLERFGRAAGTLIGADTTDGQRELDIFENRLVGDEVVALKDESDGMVAVGVPVAVGIALCAHAVDDQVAVVIAIQSADDIQQGRFTGAALSEDRDKFIVTQAQ